MEPNPYSNLESYPNTTFGTFVPSDSVMWSSGILLVAANLSMESLYYYVRLRLWMVGLRTILVPVISMESLLLFLVHPAFQWIW